MSGYLLYFLLFNCYALIFHSISKAAHQAASIAGPSSPHGVGRPPLAGRISIFNPDNNEWMYSNAIQIATTANATLRAVDAATMLARNPEQLSNQSTTTSSLPPSTLNSFVEQIPSNQDREHNPIDACDVHSHESETAINHETTPKSMHYPQRQQVSYPSNPDFYPQQVIQTETIERPRRRTLLQRLGCLGITASIGISMANLILLTILIHMQKTNRV